MRRRAGFTLLEVVVALSILGLALMAIYDLNAGAIASHAYVKKLTVASMLARSKMTDVEQELYDKGFSADDEEKSGDFSDEGWSAFKWRATIAAPKTNGVSPEQLLGAIFNLPLGGSGSSSDPLGALSALFGGGTSAPKPPDGQSSGSAPTPTPGGPLSSPMGALGANMLQNQFTQLVDQITKSVREVHLTVSWKEGKNIETLDVVTHVVSMGPGGDRNGNLAAAAQQAALQASGGLVNSRTGQPCLNPRPGPGGGMIDPQTGDPCVPANQSGPGGVFGPTGSTGPTGPQRPPHPAGER
ncbi:MAG TPA: prepilin-type N-terminal cleavage/methylation domain-containing protein [Myxococcaceae bacterium]|nr:prepilin-type N-terminal cleavage/methylation domain-containing protein [Myxococcaceae bacterium]